MMAVQRRRPAAQEVDPLGSKRAPFGFRPNMIGRAFEGHLHLDWVRSAKPLSARACDRMVRIGRSFACSPPTVVFGRILVDHRIAEVHKLPIERCTEPIYRLLWDVARDATSRHYDLRISGIDREPHYVEYRAGRGHFHWHNDYSHESEISPRKLTVVVQLSASEDYEGGDLEVFGTQPVAMPRERGAIICLPSFVPHRVTPVSRGLRRAIVAWIAGPRLL